MSPGLSLHLALMCQNVGEHEVTMTPSHDIIVVGVSLHVSVRNTLVIDRCISRMLGGLWCHFASDWGLGACIREAMKNETYYPMSHVSIEGNHLLRQYHFKQHGGCPHDMVHASSRYATCHLKAQHDQGPQKMRRRWPCLFCRMITHILVQSYDVESLY